jgi:hypothetical protein
MEHPAYHRAQAMRIARQSLWPVATLWLIGTVALWWGMPALGLALLAATAFRGGLAWRYADAAAEALIEQRRYRVRGWAYSLPPVLVETFFRKYRLGGWSRGPLLRAELAGSWLLHPQLAHFDLDDVDVDAGDVRSSLHTEARTAANAIAPRSVAAELAELHTLEQELIHSLPTEAPYGFLTWVSIATRARLRRLGRLFRRAHRARQVPAARADEVQP